jgi:hypothetical protein
MDPDIEDRWLAREELYASWYASGRITESQLETLEYYSTQQAINEQIVADIGAGNIGDAFSHLGDSFGQMVEDTERNVEEALSNLAGLFGFGKGTKKDGDTSE